MVASQRAPYHASDYWKFPFVASNEHNNVLKVQIDRPGGRHYTSATTRPRLVELVKRTARGLRCYDGDSPTELSHFISQRGINPTSSNTKKKQELITILESADEEATFDRFFDLPAELRVFVYELHFASYTCERRAIESPTPPPITQVDTMLREETLKLFYSTCEFLFNFHSSIGNPTLHFDDVTGDLIRKLTLTHLPDVRNMRIRVSWAGNNNAHYVASVVRLPLDGEGKLSMDQDSVIEGNQRTKLASTKLTHNIRQFVDHGSAYEPKTVSSVLANLIFFINCRLHADESG
ncbi:unnamed protein product [Zymoseptoria tritici ST99CH_1A5]|uniref:Uncharacterized protein n=1 Tax=Zymoseptoria tritici ST99CH_1A5 TaxID=1276529 RepID=A0A1Y6LYA5_ZYMTR|nr:unnamed protein product [Zymoseptoria tritici ST99CH_1A5]